MRDLRDTPTELFTSGTPGFIPGMDVTGSAKPYYPEGTRVRFKLGPVVQGEGTIVGLHSQHVIDTWLIKVDPKASTLDPTLYPWSTIACIHTLIEAIPQ